jgi:hypothetical protein
MGMSYYGRMAFDKANQEFRAKQEFQKKRDHFEETGNCGCEICETVDNANKRFAKQEADKIAWANMNEAERAEHIRLHMEKLKRDFPHMYGAKK